MEKYHKIQTVFKRNPKNKTLIFGDYTLPEFEYLKNNLWVFTEKVDGTNIRVMFANDGDMVEFRGKTDRAQLPSKLAKTFKSNFSNGVCLYGEGYGAKIQKGGGNYRQDQDFVLFDVKIGALWLRRKDVEDIGHQFKLDVVPIIGTGTLPDMVEKTQAGFSSAWGNFIAAGIVARPLIELKTRNGHRLITKIKHKDFYAPNTERKRNRRD